MVWFRFRKPKYADQVFALYAAIVAQSRQEKLFAEWQVPDTMTGRFDMMSLHLSLVLRRLRSKDALTQAFSQQLFDFFFKDMDRVLRETGVSDVALPKRIESMGELFYGLLEALTGALSDEDPAILEQVLVKNIFSGQPGEGASALAHYVRAEALRLDNVSIETLMSGNLDFDPKTTVA